MPKHEGMLRRVWLLTLWACALVACAARPEVLPAPHDVLPSADAVPGWREQEGTATYGRDTLHSVTNGAADLYLAYGFEELAMGRYTDATGDVVQVEVYRVETDADAYGLFTYNSRGKPMDLGADGELESGYRLAFWQGRTFVQIVAREQVDDAALRAFGAAVASALPEGGKRPSLIAALPTDGMRPGNVRFFREKKALDKYIWLGSEDVLGLGADTEGVLAWYEINGQDMRLVLIAFPDPQSAQAAQSALRGPGIEDLVTTDVTGSTLGAVFGRLDEKESGCGCSADTVVLVSDQLPEEVAEELLHKAMAALQ